MLTQKVLPKGNVCLDCTGVLFCTSVSFKVCVLISIKTHGSFCLGNRMVMLILPVALIELSRLVCYLLRIYSAGFSLGEKGNGKFVPLSQIPMGHSRRQELP